MKVAVCLSGCPRDWRKGIVNIQTFIRNYEKMLGETFQVSYFFAFWDFLSPSMNFEHYGKLQELYGVFEDPRFFCFRLDKTEQVEILETLNPVHFKFYLFEQLQKFWDQGLCSQWLYGPAFLMLESLRFRRLSGERFDLCIWTRTDVNLKLRTYHLPDEDRLVGAALYREDLQGVVTRGFKDQFFFGKPELVDLAGYIYRCSKVDRQYDSLEYIEEIFAQELEYNGVGIDTATVDVSLIRGFEQDLLDSFDKYKEKLICL